MEPPDSISILKKYTIPLILAGLGVICLGYGLIVFLGNQPKNDVSFTSAHQQTATESATSSQKLFVDIEGAVRKPGVYKMDADNRIQDLLQKAGGFSENADRDGIAKSLNLAQKLMDGMKLYIPKTGEAATSTGFAGDSAVLGTQSGLVNINTASENQLDALPGIGTVTAQKIINGRPYSSLDELTAKKIVSQKVFAQIKDKISLY